MDTSQIPRDAYVASPSDTAAQGGSGLVFAGGDCVVETDAREDAGNVVTLNAAFAGVVIPLRIKKVRAAGTTATNILVFR